ncbi:MAG: hypothetical protein FJ148_26295 [Deltaproteobacteria bacterium]|nr:hypothetical protein [Deltaproteobacteria bacterium]
MQVRILLLAGGAEGETIEVSRTVELETVGPEWRSALVHAVAAHAGDTARCLLGQIEPALPAAAPVFVPLAHVLEQYSA